ncbi:glucose-6-phosphate dehydrogenase [Acidobacteriia bacterium AH_259_A11_L15]|nr:glucose-6-phosphate dehydrogenase [Acidobacteriia bacterium AH_259_A11_L15]
MRADASRTQQTPRPTSAPRPLDPCGIVIFGASGDLTARLLMPALYDLAETKNLPENFYILGAARKPLSPEQFRNQMQAAVNEFGRFRPEDQSKWKEFAQRVNYFPVDAKKAEDYQRLREHLKELDRQYGVPGNYLFYLAVPPGLYSPIVEQLGGAGLAASGPRGRGWTRIVLEKPIGHNRESARRLNKQVCEIFQEEQVYRIDHFLGKETVQNLAVFRFANGIFEPIWNRNFIDHVQITVAEDIGIGHRAGFYEKAGAVQDMIQNHLLQLLCLVAMEPPASFEATPVQEEKVKVLQCMRAVNTGNAVRGQYGPGRIDGKEVAGYRQEEGVGPNSATETFAAVKFEIENWRWAGVPFYVRTGKRMARKASEITIQFRDAPLTLFACTAMQPCEPNLLTLRIQPNEGMGLRVIAKTPGLDVIGHSVQLDFAYSENFKQESPSGYETLLLDCMEGDPMLFARGDWIERSWELLDPLLKVWAENPPKDFPNYSAGSWGPPRADELLRRVARQWHLR